MTKFDLRRFHKNDAMSLFNSLKDDRVIKHMASTGFTIKICQEIIDKSDKHWKKYKIGDFAVIDKVTNDIIGWAGFKFWQENQFEILVVLTPDSWGLGHQIYSELIDLAKNQFKLNEIYILLPKTRKSFRAVESLGFKFSEETTFNNKIFIKFIRRL